MKSVPNWTQTFRQTPIQPVMKQMPYTTRLLACRACGHPKETAHMQLKMSSGYRGICCTNCHKQARVSQHKCQCLTIWHRCPTHCHDPAVHRSEKPAERDQLVKSRKIKDLLPLHRPAPEALIKGPIKRRRLDGRGRASNIHSHNPATGSGATVAPQLDPSLYPLLAAKFPHLTTRG